MLVPAPALLIDAHGTRVALIGPDDTLHYRPIDIGRDYGDRVEVLNGLAPEDVIATALPSGLPDGSKVKNQSDQPAGVSAGSS